MKFGAFSVALEKNNTYIYDIGQMNTGQSQVEVMKGLLTLFNLIIDVPVDIKGFLFSFGFTD